jgi:lactate dehydrogenase-like 2-hydroxyacid dehydrogenase
LLVAADVVSLNCPLNAKTRGMIGREQFSWMKDGTFLVNTARGALIDEDALIDVLESGKVERAGMDVFVGEPKPK